MIKERDSQKSKLYKAEKVLEQVSNRLETLAEIEAYINLALNRAPIKSRYSRWTGGHLMILDGRGATFARGGQRIVKFPRWSRTQYIVLHELAHVIAQRKYGVYIAGHGRLFCEVYLNLVRFVMGVAAHDLLKASFKEHKVKFRPKRGTTPKVLPGWSLMPPTVKPKFAPKPKVRTVDKDYQEFRALIRKHGFTYTKSSDGYIEIPPSTIFPHGFTTLHHSWYESVRRLELCLEDPSVMAEEGYYTE